MWNLINGLIPEILTLLSTVLTGFAATALNAFRKKMKTSLSKDQMAMLHTAIESGLRYAKSDGAGRNKVIQDFVEDALRYVLRSVPETVFDLKKAGATDNDLRNLIESKATDVLGDALKRAMK